MYTISYYNELYHKRMYWCGTKDNWYWTSKKTKAQRYKTMNKALLGLSIARKHLRENLWFSLEILSDFTEE